MKTYVQKPAEQKLQWYLVDAKDQVLGRLASKIASVLRGKNTPTFTPHLNNAVGVIVINIEQIKITGNKAANKNYYWHTGHPGGIKVRTYNQLAETKPEMPLFRAVKGMLPKNKLRDQFLTRLRIYTGEAHPHAAQQPIKLEL